MKTLKTLTASLLVILSVSAFATTKPGNEKLEMNYALKIYIDAIAHGKVKPLAEVLDADAKFSIAQGNKISTYTRGQMLNLLKSSENVEQNCELDYNAVQENATQAIIKVSMKYPGFSKDSFVSLLKTSKGWKITNVSSGFSN